LRGDFKEREKIHADWETPSTQDLGAERKSPEDKGGGLNGIFQSSSKSPFRDTAGESTSAGECQPREGAGGDIIPEKSDRSSSINAVRRLGCWTSYRTMGGGKVRAGLLFQKTSGGK